MEIIYFKNAAKALRKMDASTKERIKNRIQGLTENPPIGDIQPMEGFSNGSRRLRVGDLRVIFRYAVENDEKLVYIIDIGYRGDVYK